MDTPDTPKRAFKAGIYARRSRAGTPGSRFEKQLEAEVENQVRELKQYCDNHGWEYKVYADLSPGGKQDNRLQYLQLLEDARMRKIDAVVVWKLDRFSRNITDFLMTVGQLDADGVRFISATQGIDTNKASPTSRLLMNILAAFAQFESELISERIKAGIERRRAEGKAIGRQRIDIDPDWVKELKNDDGLSIRAISEIVGCSRGTVHRLLKASEKDKKLYLEFEDRD